MNEEHKIIHEVWNYFVKGFFRSWRIKIKNIAMSSTQYVIYKMFCLFQGVSGALTVLMKDAVRLNLMQTLMVLKSPFFLSLLWYEYKNLQTSSVIHQYSSSRQNELSYINITDFSTEIYCTVKLVFTNTHWDQFVMLVMVGCQNIAIRYIKS